MYRPDRRRIREVYDRGGVLAYPTEGVWGLGCNPADRDGVAKILSIKRRPVRKGVILVTGHIRHVDFLLQPLSTPLRERALSYWPGHHTLLVPDIQEQIPWYIKGEFSSVAIRVSSHPFIHWFSSNVAPLLVSTSANIAGKPACSFRFQVRQHFRNTVDYIAPGITLGASGPSQIIDLASGKKMR